MEADRAAIRMGWLALACVLAMGVVIAASAWLRLAAPRADCADWPVCRAAAVTPPLPVPVAAPGPGESVVRGLHRGAASTMLVLLIVLLGLVWRHRGRSGGMAALVVALLGLALGLSALGIVGAGSRALPVVLGNLLGGFAMAALSWSLTRRLAAAAPPAAGARLGSGFVALLWLSQAALGGTSGLGVAGAVVPLLHVLLGIAAATSALLLGLVLWRSPQRVEGRALVVLSGAQLLLGVATSTLGAPAMAVLLHNALAAAGLALCSGLALARR
jgi:cytochrome c oxidase assembly protein subunit 15